MKHFPSHDDQAWHDLRHGGQLAGLFRLAARPPASADDFCWQTSAPAAAPWAPAVRTAARTDALDAADYLTRFLSLVER